MGHCGREGGSPNFHERHSRRALSNHLRCLRRYCEWPSPPGNEEEDDSEGRTWHPQRLAPPLRGALSGDATGSRDTCRAQPSSSPQISPPCPSTAPGHGQALNPAKPHEQNLSHSTAALPAGPSHTTPSIPLHPSSIQPHTAPSAMGQRASPSATPGMK